MIKFSFSKWIIPIICTLITGYFIYHTIKGNHGIERGYEIDREIELAKISANLIRQQRDLLAQKTTALSHKSLDLDQLEESALLFLNMGHPEDMIIFTPLEKK